MGHMNVMWYSGKFDEANWQLLAMLGLHPSRFGLDGTGMAAVEQHTQYKRELVAGDTITIQSSVLEVKDKSIQLIHKMMHDTSGEVAATTVVVAVYIDANIRKAIRFPEDVRQKALAMKETVLEQMGE
jgi:acyl-CoA thioester hydrolase